MDTEHENETKPAQEGTPRLLWHANATIATMADGKALCFTDYATPEDTGRAAGVAALEWTNARGHVYHTADEGEALLFVARPFRVTNPEEPRAFRTGVRLYAVPLDKTGEFLRDRIGTLFDVQEARTKRGTLDIWLADDFGEVYGVNPLLSRLAGFRKWYPGPAVFAGSKDGATVSLPHYMEAANLAATWRDACDQITRALNRTANAAAPACLAAHGLELCEFFVEPCKAPDGFEGISVDSRTPDGAPADLLRNCMLEEERRAG